MLTLMQPAHRGLAFLVTIVASFSASASIAPSYRVVGLGQLGQSNYAYHVNEHGDVVGAFYSSTDANDFHAYLYHDGQMLDLFPGERSRAHSINDAGTIVGFGTATERYRGWVYANGVRTPIPLLGGSENYAQGITEAGLVVGYASSGSSYHPYIYDGQSLHDLGLPAGANYAYGSGINAGGDVVGVASHSGFNYPVLYSAGGWQYLGNEYPRGGWAISINNTGVVTGYVQPTSGGTRAFRYSNGSLKLLGSATFDNALGNCVSDEGLIVGTYGATNQKRAFIDDGVVTIDLNSLLLPGSGWILREASDINEKGEIVGWGINPAGEQRAFLLEPVVPEPSSFAIAAAWAVGATCARRRCQRS